MTNAMVLVGGPGAGQLVPADRDIYRVPVPRGGFVEYHRHRVVAGLNVWTVGVHTSWVWSFDAQTIESFAALLALTPDEREQCLVTRLPE